MAIDLHIHTTHSDGTLTPEAVVDLAREAGLTAIAITDHDTVSGVAAATETAGSEIEVVAGLELSAQGPGEPDVHVLGYFVDPAAPGLLRTLISLRTARTARAVTMVQSLTAAGYRITWPDVLQQAGAGAVGRSHVARALLSNGEVASLEEAFIRLIGARAPFYFAKRSLTLGDAVALVHDAGGAAVLAHPGITGEGSLVALVDEGLDGIEAYHAEHTTSQRAHFAALAKRFGLVATGGSDFHGPGAKGALIGAGECPPHALDSLRERAAVRRS